MRNETIAIHGGYETDPTTKAVAVPIYQTVAYEFDSADHGAALFNLETTGYRYAASAIPTTAVLERRVAALEGGVEALCVGTGQAALNYAMLNLDGMGSNIVSVPQLYGTTYTLFAHVCRARASPFALPKSDQPEAIEELIDDDTKAVFCESVGNPAGNICDIEALAEVAHRHGVPLIVDNTVATPDPAEADRVRRRHRRAFADQVHGRARHDAGRRHRRQRQVSRGSSTPTGFPMFNQPDASYHGLVYTEHFGDAAYIARCRSVYQRTTGAVLAPLSAFLLLQGIETRGAARRAPRREARRVAEFLRRRSRAWTGSTTPAFPTIPITRWRRNISAAAPARCMTFGVNGGFEAGKTVLRRAQADQAAGQHRRRQVARLPSGLDHAPADVAEEQQRKAGVGPEMIRLSIGIEHIDDIIADLDQALDAIASASRALAAE